VARRGAGGASNSSGGGSSCSGRGLVGRGSGGRGRGKRSASGGGNRMEGSEEGGAEEFATATAVFLAQDPMQADTGAAGGAFAAAAAAAAAGTYRGTNGLLRSADGFVQWEAPADRPHNSFQQPQSTLTPFLSRFVPGAIVPTDCEELRDSHRLQYPTQHAWRPTLRCWLPSLPAAPSTQRPSLGSTTGRD